MIADRRITERPGERAGIALIMGALALIAGELPIVAGLLWHPVLPRTAFVSLQAIAANDNWQLFRYMQMLGAAALAFGMVEASALAGRAAQIRIAVFAILGSASLIVAFALDGVALKEIADAFVHAPAPGRDAIEVMFWTVLGLQSALLSVGSVLLFGATTVAVATLIARTGRVRIAARVGQVIGGVAGLAALLAFVNPTVRPLLPYPITVLLTSAWALWMGIALWRGRNTVDAVDASPLAAA